MSVDVTHCDVIVVGAGPGGAATAAWLAAHGRHVIMLEKDAFPRDKVCGDGLTPRVVQELLNLGMVDEAKGVTDGWATQKGLRIHGGHTVMELPWPDLDDWPNWGATCTRMIFDDAIAQHAVGRGAQLWQRHMVTEPVWHDASQSRVAGVRYAKMDDDGKRTGDEGVVLAPVVIAADGASGAFAKHLGLHRRKDRPMAVAVRTYYESDRASDNWISSYLDLKDESGDLLSGYGWVFPLDDGTINVGLGLLNTSKEFQQVNYRKLMEAWSRGMAPEWGTTVEAQRGRIQSGPIPMGFNRTPLHTKGVLLVGDSGGFVNPFNGEGISYAMEAGKLAADVANEAISQSSTAVLDSYDRELRQRWGGYYSFGKIFAQVMGDPRVMHICTEYGMPVRPLMELVFKLMAHLTDEKPSDVKDLTINWINRLMPVA